eukprot:1857587-Pyramimonas_sp.AAC.1
MASLARAIEDLGGMHATWQWGPDNFDTAPRNTAQPDTIRQVTAPHGTRRHTHDQILEATPQAPSPPGTTHREAARHSERSRTARHETEQHGTARHETP